MKEVYDHRQLRVWDNDSFSPEFLHLYQGLYREGYIPAEKEKSPWNPEVKLLDYGEYLHITADLPGVSPRDVELELDYHILKLHVRRGSVDFTHEVRLPFVADKNELSATFRGDYLLVTIHHPCVKNNCHYWQKVS